MIGSSVLKSCAVKTRRKRKKQRQTDRQRRRESKTGESVGQREREREKNITEKKYIKENIKYMHNTKIFKYLTYNI